MDQVKDFYYLGVDVQIKRGCPYCVLDSSLDCVASGWLTGHRSQIAGDLLALILDLNNSGLAGVAVGIDAPRIGLEKKREKFWRSGEWTEGRSAEKGYGRHCEVVVKALNIANPQWTPPFGSAPDWMKLGFELFQVLAGFEDVYEVFPAASYRLLNQREQPQVSLSFADFLPGPKDMLDACISAFTVHEYLSGRGSEVGGGDGLGTIILPAPLPVPQTHPVLTWPDQ